MNNRQMIETVLRNAKCPVDCDNGVNRYLDARDDPQSEKCQFCHKREQALATLEAVEPDGVIEEDGEGLYARIDREQVKGGFRLYYKASVGDKVYLRPLRESAQPAPDDFIDRLELQIAWRLEEQLCNGSIGPDQFVANNRELLRDLIAQALSASPPAQPATKEDSVQNIFDRSAAALWSDYCDLKMEREELLARISELEGGGCSGSAGKPQGQDGND